jgi:hypothetical protein
MKQKKTAEFVGSAIASVIGLVLVNTVLLWRHLTNGVVLGTWVDILWASNLSFLVQLVGSIVLATYRPARLHSFIMALQAVFGLVSVIVFYLVFPLDFSRLVGEWLNTVVKAALIVAMAGTSIAVIVEAVRAMAGTPYSTVQKSQRRAGHRSSRTWLHGTLAGRP